MNEGLIEMLTDSYRPTQFSSRVFNFRFLKQVFFRTQFSRKTEASFNLIFSEPESRRRLIYVRQSNTVRDATCNTFGSDSLHKKVDIGSKTGVIVASSSMGLNIFDLFNEIINVDDMKLGCLLEKSP